MKTRHGHVRTMQITTHYPDGKAYTALFVKFPVLQGIPTLREHALHLTVAEMEIEGKIDMVYLIQIMEDTVRAWWPWTTTVTLG